MSDLVQNKVTQFWNSFGNEGPFYIFVFLGSEGNWRDRWTNQSEDFFSIPWRIASEPTGFQNENCSGHDQIQ